MPNVTLAITHPATRAVNTSLLLKTGQTTSYGSGTGVDDGALKLGIAKSYKVLTLDQYSGTKNIVVNSKTDQHSNNCVLDLNTGLMWTRYASASVGPASNGKLPWTTTGSGGTAEGIFPYLAAANAAALAGYTDWRVPNIYSLLSIMNYAAPSAIPDSTAFPSFPADVFWCSTSQPNNTANAIQPSFLQGGAAYGIAKTGTAYLLLVRGNP